LEWQNQIFGFVTPRSQKIFVSPGVELWDGVSKFDTYSIVPMLTGFKENQTLISTLFEVLKKSRDPYEAIATSHRSL
jgi:hypothetical protein